MCLIIYNYITSTKLIDTTRGLIAKSTESELQFVFYKFCVAMTSSS